MQHLPSPATGTFAVSYGSTDARRYDALVLDDLDDIARGRGLDLGSDLLTDVLPVLDGDPSVVDLGPVEDIDGHHEVPYEETFNDRRLHAHAYAIGGVVIAVDVGVRAGSPAGETDIARSDLSRMRETIALPDPARRERCDAHGEGPLTGPRDDRPVTPDDV